MNKQQTALKVRDTIRKYKEQGSDSPCRKNHIVLNAANRWKHEQMKCYLCHRILNGQIPYNQKDREILFAIGNAQSFITEAVDRRTEKRRDVVILETDTIIEIVNQHDSAELMKEYKADDVLVIRV